MSKIKFASGSIPVETTTNNVIEGKEQIVKVVKPEEEYHDKKILRVLPEKSSKFSRSFALNDGTIKSVYSSSPINYYDEQEKVWKELDSTLQDEGDNYVSNLGKYKAKIKKNGEVAGVTVGDGNSYVEWQFLGTKIEGNKYCLKDKKCKPNVKVDNYKKDKDIFSYGKLKYLSCDDGVDIEYITQGNGVKENIIVNKKSEEYKYYFSLKSSGLKVKIDEQGDNIIFYTEKEGKEEVELMIPAPYMYDNVQEYSDEVLFELTKVKEGEYVFTVEADAKWINQEDRMFPVTIDPQVLLYGSPMFVFEQETQAVGGDWSNITYATTSDMVVSKNSAIEKRSFLHIDRNYVPMLESKMMVASLYIPINSINANCNLKFIVGEKTFTKQITTDMSFINLDITELYKLPNDTGYFSMIIQGENLTTGSNIVMCSGVNAVLSVEYVPGEEYSPTIKELSFTGGVKGELNIGTGELNTSFVDVIDNVIGMQISHSYKRSEEDFGVGDNFRLNVYESFKKNTDSTLNAQYIYSDAKGNKHNFTEYFYYTVGKKKKYINVSQVSTDTEGNLTYGEHSVIREFRSSSGLQAITQYEGLQNISLLNQKNEEFSRLEKQMEDYDDFLKNYSLFIKEEYVDLETAIQLYQDLKIRIAKLVKGKNPLAFGLLLSPTIVQALQPTTSLVLTEEQSMQYDSLMTQLDSIDNQISSIEAQDEYYEYILNNSQNNDDYESILNMQKNANIGQKQILEEQKDNILKQIEYIQNNQEKIKQVIEEYRLEYIKCADQLLKLKKSTPVNYITDGRVFKGFNEEGRLVVIFEETDNAIGIEYKKINGKERVFEIYKENIGKINFEYLIEYGNDLLLSAITDSRGNRVEFSYENGYLKTFKNAEGELITFSYNNDDICQIESSNNFKSTLSYSNHMLIGGYNYSTSGPISYENVGELNDTEMDKFSLDYSMVNNAIMQYAIFTQGNSIKEKFVFDTSGEKTGAQGNLKEYYKEEFGLVTQAEKYEYYPPFKNGIKNTGINPRKVETRAKKDILNLTDLSNFAFGSNYSQKISYIDEFYNVYKTTGPIDYIDSDKTVTLCFDEDYEYNTDNRLIKQTVKETYNNLSTNIKTVYTHINTYQYNSFGQILKEESYVEGEELKYGKVVTENVYDKKGRKVKSFTYNTLNTADKQYSECKYNDVGLISKQYDDSGENYTKYSYYDCSDQIVTKTLPNDSKFSYGMENGKVTAISHSDENGEANENQILYNKGLQARLKSNNCKVDYVYDGKRNLSEVKINDQTVFTQTDNSVLYSETTDFSKYYQARGGDTNLDCFNLQTDYQGNPLNVKYGYGTSGTTLSSLLSYTYDKDKNITQCIGSQNTTNNYTYDYQNRLTKHTFGYNSIEYNYNDFGNLQTKTNKLYKEYSGGAIQTQDYIYNYTYSDDSKKRLTQMSIGDITESYGYDSLERNKSIVQSLGGNTYKKEYGYYKVADHTTGLINVEKTYQNGTTKDKITYTYDCMGNITKIVKNGIVLKEYKYDSLGRIIYENNIDTGREISYTYDNQGNILSKTENGTKTDYVYDENGFKLLSYGNQAYTYDNLGNPLNLNSTYYSASWTRAHLLKTLMAGSHSVNFTYDGEGLLIGRSIGGGNANYTFVYDGDKLIRQTYNNTTHTEFLYGKEGLIGFISNGATYLYQKNIFGDIVKIVDNAGQVVAEYSYTAFGECTIVTNVNNIANANPFRYRGYFLESNSGLYYLKSRFYNPVTGRFISPDDTKYLQPDVINGLNLFAYCGNNPVMNIDPNGNAWWNPKDWNWKAIGKVATGIAIIGGAAIASVVTGGAASVIFAGAAIGATASGVGAAVSTAVSGGSFNDFANSFLMGTVTGAISGAVAASPLGVGAQIGINAVLGTGNYAGTQLLSGNNITLGGLIVNAGIGALCGWIGQSGWMQGQTTSAFISFVGKNALKHIVGMVGTKTLLRMTLSIFILGGVGGGIYGRLSKHFNPNGNFIGI